ncbi:Lrrc52 [Phodopus roborovskii]|uniref:Lrrc52 protein n=1 Tax=Phodopus roborovskii TaxID=109678 RepID=A0AAU9ZA25_PHORO|nr:Lrrc52 [Phodopus roborovskii]
MSLASGPGPQLLLFSLGMGLVSGSKCPNNCLCQDQEVFCTNMQLTEYPLNIPLNTRRLFLSNNKITSLPALQLGFLSDLVYLDCQNNRIRELMDYTFIGVFKLIYLDLSSNNLTSISPFTFSVLNNLVRLNISNNPHLLSLDKYIFANTSSLRYLDLRNTGLQTMDHDALHHLVVLQTLYLSGNPWKCNCSFLEFAIHLLVAEIDHPAAATLATDPSLSAMAPSVPQCFFPGTLLYPSIPRKSEFQRNEASYRMPEPLLLSHLAIPSQLQELEEGESR